MGRRPDSTFGKCKIVIGMLTAGMMNKQIVRHFQACQSMISSPQSQNPSDGQCQKSKTMQTDHVRPPGEKTLTR